MKTNKFISIILILTLILPVFGQSFQMPETVATISVAVTGYVEIPGIYQLRPVDRLSEALAAAVDKTFWVPEEIPGDPTALKLKDKQTTKEEASQKEVFNAEIKKNQGLRSIKIIRGNQTIDCDLQMFLRSGDLSQNPILRDGDVVVVSPLLKTVSITGAVYFPEEFEYRDNDTIGSILKLAKGFKPEADLSQVKLYRYRSNMIDYDVQVYDLNNSAQLDVPIVAYDRIIVPANADFRRNWVVQVNGHVQSPGTYRIDGKTTLYDILVECGGPSAKADLHNAIIVNRAMYHREEPDVLRLSALSMNSMTIFEYAYLRAKTRQLKGRYSANPGVAWETKGSEDNPVLIDGDTIYVPENVEMIYVSGQVKNPGLVPWVEGKDWKYYIEQAGGYANNRGWSGSRILHASTGVWVKPTKDTQINRGDTVFVPEASDRDFWLNVKDTLTIASQVMTIILGFRAITR